MVPIAKEKLDEATLMRLTRQEVLMYAGYSPVAKLYPVLDDENRTYVVIIIDEDPDARPAYAVVMARVIGDKVIIDEDRTDKPLYQALMHNVGIPREQIILAYAGESAESSEQK